ncbi:MAG: hypothetical protein H0V68_00385 [Actinobacteria bacterium]|nr:hypothetical protein [Actinomycetota bacterium]
MERGTYVLAYWCRGCLPHGKAVGVQFSPGLRINGPSGDGCHTTTPNGHLPPGGRGLADGRSYHGNGMLWALLPSNGLLVTNALGGHKMIWVADPNVSANTRLTVRYRLLDPASPPLGASTGGGTLTGYDGPSWASRMSFEPGCWQVTGRVLDATLSFVVQVVRGSG